MGERQKRLDSATIAMWLEKLPLTLAFSLIPLVVGRQGTNITNNVGTHQKIISLNARQLENNGDYSQTSRTGAEARMVSHDMKQDSNLTSSWAHVAGTEVTVSHKKGILKHSKEGHITVEAEGGHLKKHRHHIIGQQNVDELLIIRPKEILAHKSVVGSITSTPKRLREINGALGDTLKRLLSFKSLDMIYLNIPWSYGMRKRDENYKLSSDMETFLAMADGRLTILRCRDYGPSTKLLPLLLLSEAELSVNATIITFDDDRLYEESAIQALVDESRENPDASVAIAAWPIDILSSNGRRGKVGGPDFKSRIPEKNHGIQYIKRGPTDLVLGFFGVLYKKRFFSNGTSPDAHLFSYSVRPEFLTHCAWVDDIWFSGHLERLNISKLVVGKKAGTSADPTKLSNVDALSLEKGESVKQNHDNVLCAEAMRKEYGIWG